MKAVRACEVELKAHVRNVDQVRAFLREHAVFKRKYFKRDRYLSPNGVDAIDAMIRLRNANGGWVFTSKTRRIEQGVEINDEKEMPVRRNDARKIIRFLTGVLGYTDHVLKEKKGRAYTYRGVLIEFSEVSTLGNFIELEILDGSAPEQDQIALLHSILAELGIPESDIETEPYVSLLAKNTRA